MRINKLFATALIAATILSCDTKSENKTNTAQSDKAELLADTNISTPKAFFYVNALSGLSLRAGTNLKSKKILTLPYGAQIEQISTPSHTEMTIDGVTGEMVEVNYQGATGFVFNGYLTALAPPQAQESLEDYTKRISTPINKIEIVKTADSKGEASGMKTQVVLPAKNWNEMYRISKRLFHLPKSISPDFTATESTLIIVNEDKRERTLTDELIIVVNETKQIDSITYFYSLKNYKRTVIIKESEKGYEVIENEISL